MRTIIIILLCFSSVLNSGAEVQDSLFREANQHYQAEKYEAAIRDYLKVDSLGYESSDLYYNLGNAFFRSNKLGKARLYYERALLLNPGNDDVKTNLNYIRSLLTDRFDDVPELFYKRWYHNFVALMSSDDWFLFSLITFLTALLGFLAYVFSRKTASRKIGFFIGMIFLIIALLSFLFSWQQSKSVTNPGTAVIMTGSQTVKSAPRQNAKDLFILHEGTKVKVENELENWNEIQISDGRKGWIPDESLEMIR